MSTTTPAAADSAASAAATPSPSSGAGVQAGGSEARGGNSSDMDSEMQSNKPLFLNFTAELAPFTGPGKRQKKKSNVYKVSGVNILNRNSVDSKTALERLQRRRENHNFVERRRRDNINHTITSLSTLIPYCTEDGVKLNKGSILHMAVDYIRDLQEINAALAEENVRLGGSGNPPLPGRRSRDSLHSSSVDTTAPHSADDAEYDDDEDEDDADGADAERTLPQSLAASPSVGPAATSITTAVAAAIGGNTPKRRRTSPAQAARTASGKRPAAIARKTSAKASARTKAKAPAAPGLAGVLSPPLTTAAPSAAASTNTSPLALAAMLAPMPAVRSGSSGRTANQPLPPITLAPPPPQLPALSQLGAAPVRRHAAAQSMPSSPCFRAHQSAARFGDHAAGARHVPGFANHPFFNSDVSSIRHHMQQQQQPLPAVLENREPGCEPVSAGAFQPPQQQQRRLPVHFPQSLQSTPLMRPSRDFAPGASDAFDLPSLPSLRPQQQ
ncbi:hypothetical protein IWW45_002320 [Coemansia sp. RSA 485]|nr:hypothetical protein IWW45_002320 [Coemansia sp. RSA 485]KAJ2603454.1 hypothetical protein GGF39_000178 [Coemansia sp. RSA 1721]